MKDNIPLSSNLTIGIKESDGKIDYSEIDWKFVTRMAIRMNKNKAKYGKNNWKLPINLEEIEQALLRHVVAILNPVENDPETRQEHLAAIGCNAQILNFHLDESQSKQPGVLD